MKQTLSRTLLIGTVVAAALGACVVPALASVLPDDVQPPPWRGQPGTTSQYWLFSSSLTSLLPDGSMPAHDLIPGGLPPLPSTHITVQPASQWVQSDPVSLRNGIWSLAGGRMDVMVDNFPVANPVKIMWVQVVWQPIPGLPPTGPILDGFNPPAGTPVTAVGPVGLPLGWFETTYKWELFPNPPDESFILSGNINVDQLIIDTVCIPEPSALLLTTLGGGLLLVLRWRRQR